jgi:hypothetical protein
VPIIQPRLIAAFKVPLPVPALLKTSQALVVAFTGNALLPNPTPSLTTVGAAIANLDTAETATKARTKGTIATRNEARATLVGLLRGLKAYVQQQADANPEHAEAIITSVGMTVKKAPARTKAPFAVKPGPVTGSVKLVAKSAGPRASYDWEWSADGGKTWTQVLPTLQAKTTVIGLPVATTCEFRYRATTKAGAGDWSQAITLVVK